MKAENFSHQQNHLRKYKYAWIIVVAVHIFNASNPQGIMYQCKRAKAKTVKHESNAFK